MRVEAIGLEPPNGKQATNTHTTAGPFHSRPLSRQLNILLTGDDAAGYHAADLLGHVLYGARLAGYRRAGHSDWSGHVDVADGPRRYRLRREAPHGDVAGRLTLAAIDATPAGSDTIERLLGGISPTIAARLLAFDCADASFPLWVFSEELARELRRLEQSRGKSALGEWATTRTTSARESLITRRDQLSLAIEQRLAEARSHGVELDGHWREAMSHRDQTQLEAERLRSRLAVVESELAEVDAEWHHRELSNMVAQTVDRARATENEPQLADIDDQIEHWRHALARLEQREAHLRSELSLRHPDESSTTLPLAEQRGCIAVAERLLRDLDSEIARFAPSAKANLCLCGDAHARLHPLVATLTEQIASLTTLVEQYETGTRIRHLAGEADHVARSQHELRGQIDFLLARRQELLRRSRLRTSLTPSTELSSEAGARRVELQHRVESLRAELADCEARLAELERRCRDFERERSELLGRDELARLRRELDEVTHAIDTVASSTSRVESHGGRPRWRASELLSKLTDGRLRELRLIQGGRDAEVTDYRGQVMLRTALDASDQQLVALSLQLASISTLAAWGMELPAVIANPCHGLSDLQSAVVAVVLHDFALSGHQLCIVSERTAALDRWRQLGAVPLEWHATQPDVAVRATREPALRSAVTQNEFRPAIVSADDEPRLLIGDDIERFPVFGTATRATFAAIGIHTVEQLLEADCERTAERLGRDGITPSVVALWQQHLGLLCFVPQIDLIDADLLVAAGISSADELADIDTAELHHRLSDFLQSERGGRFARRGYRYSRDSANRWRNAALASLAWRAEQPAWQSWNRRRGQRQSWLNRLSNQSSRTTVQPPRKSTTGRSRVARSAAAPSTPKPTLKFNLNLSSPIVDAPSIGPKSANRLAKANIRTVRDFLDCDPALVAEKLETRHITAEVLVAWQHQAQLACRIPNLKALDTQLLVGCGFTTPEAVASANAGELNEFVKAFAASSAGQRVLREADPPGIDRVEQWIELARQGRQLGAA